MSNRLTASPTINQAFVRAYVAKGAGLDPRYVIPANQNFPTPEEALIFSSVCLVTDLPNGRNLPADLDGGDRIANAQYKTASFSIQFYGTGAVDAAARLCLWANSDEALTYAEGALKDRLEDGSIPSDLLWPDGYEMRVDLPLCWDRMDAIDDMGWEERALVNMRCRYYAEFTSDDRGLDRVELTHGLDDGNEINTELTRR